MICNKVGFVNLNTLTSITLLLAVSRNSSADLAKPTLRSAQLVFRHGSRNADSDYEKRTGLLNDVGKEEMYELGKFVRQRYSSFLNDSYDPAEIQIITSGALRCIQSGALFAYGSYEDYNFRANWSGNGIHFEPIPIESIPTEIDRYLQVTDNCPRRKALKDQLTEEYYEKLMSENQLVQEFLQECSNFVDDASLWERGQPAINVIYPCVKYIEVQSRETPEWAEPYVGLYNVIIGGTNEVLSTSSEYRILAQGPFFGMLYSRMNTSQTQKKVYAYASHDFSVIALRNLFEQAKQLFPGDLPTASTFFLEIHKLPKFDDHVVEVYFRNGSSSALTKIDNIPGCSPVCFLQDFGEILLPYIPQNYEQLCNSQPPAESLNHHVSGSSHQERQGPLLATLFVIAFALTSVLMLGMLATKLIRSMSSNYQRF